MPPVAAITDLGRDQILALDKEFISFRKIAETVNRCVDIVKGGISQGFKCQVPKKWRGKNTL